MLAPDGRFAVQASLDLYSRILDVIERNEYDNFRKRAFTTKLEKLSILPGAFSRSRVASAPSSASSIKQQPSSSSSPFQTQPLNT